MKKKKKKKRVILRSEKSQIVPEEHLQIHFEAFEISEQEEKEEKKRLVDTRKEHDLAVCLFVCAGTLYTTLRYFTKISRISEAGWRVSKELSANAANVIFIYSMDCTFFHDVKFSFSLSLSLSFSSPLRVLI